MFREIVGRWSRRHRIVVSINAISISYFRLFFFFVFLVLREEEVTRSLDPPPPKKKPRCIHFTSAGIRNLTHYIYYIATIKYYTLILYKSDILITVILQLILYLVCTHLRTRMTQVLNVCAHECILYTIAYNLILPHKKI